MANTKSAKKRIRSNEHKHQRNRVYRSRVRTLIKKAETTIFKDEPSDETVLQAIQSLDKAASKGILHKNNVARRKSRLMKKFNLMQQQ